MNFNIFKAKQKAPHDLVRHVKESIDKLEGSDKRKATEEISKNLVLMKSIALGEVTDNASSDQKSQLAQEIYKADLLDLLVTNISKLEFEAKKDVASIFNILLRREIGNRSPTVEYLCAHDTILFTLLSGYDQPEIALNCGLMLRECFRYEPLAKIVLYSNEFYNFFEYVEVVTFDIASDAFASFKEILTKHKPMVAGFLETNYEEFFNHYKDLLLSKNYVTKRQSLKLLGEILLDRSNFTVMTRYISNADNLKLMMNLLRDKSRNIQFEAFHVFKVFVANPHKPKPIVDILLKNKDKLISFLTNFHNDRQDDEQFNDEKSFLVKQIQDLQPIQD